MLFPFTRSWTRQQKWLIIGGVVSAFAICGACIYGYERYYRGPGQEMLYGTWHGTLDWHGSDAYFQFSADHTFSLWDRAWFEDADKNPEFVTKGRWHAGGRFLYLRYPPDFRPDGRVLEFWHIEDISPQELRMRYWHDGGTHVFHRIDSVTTRASNHAMERTADRSANHF
ncbi:MAG TPA: hypothetical protein VEX43_05115 [Chthoniobacterales bacterium]|nr:hypothetical protein [Chthoniobacterales bacterium]